jgi:amino acid transporter
MQGPEIAIPIILFLSIAAILGAYILTRHKERMTIIDKGMNPADARALYEHSWKASNPLSSLKWGILFFCVGLAVLIGIWLRDQFWFNDGVIPGLMAVFGGAGLVLFYFIASKKTKA